jgi:hypothetical protein
VSFMNRFSRSRYSWLTAPVEKAASKRVVAKICFNVDIGFGFQGRASNNLSYNGQQVQEAAFLASCPKRCWCGVPEAKVNLSLFY